MRYTLSVDSWPVFSMINRTSTLCENDGAFAWLCLEMCLLNYGFLYNNITFKLVCHMLNKGTLKLTPPQSDIEQSMMKKSSAWRNNLYKPLLHQYNSVFISLPLHHHHQPLDHVSIVRLTIIIFLIFARTCIAMLFSIKNTPEVLRLYHVDGACFSKNDISSGITSLSQLVILLYN